MTNITYVEFLDRGFIEIPTSKTTHILNYSDKPTDSVFENDFTFIVTLAPSKRQEKEGILRIAGQHSGIFCMGDYIGVELYDINEIADGCRNEYKGDSLVVTLIKTGNTATMWFNEKIVNKVELPHPVLRYSEKPFTNTLIGASNIHNNEWSEFSKSKIYNVAMFDKALNSHDIFNITNDFDIDFCKNTYNMSEYDPIVHYDFNRHSDFAVYDESGHGNVGMFQYVKIQKEKN